MQTVKIHIDAESPDGEVIKQQTSVSVHCMHSMGVAVLANLFKENKDLRRMAMEAFILVVSNENFSEEITKSDYENNNKDPEL